MLLILYAVIIKMYGLVIAFAALFNPKARALFKGRRQQYPLIISKLEHWKDYRRVWIHAASYGEYEMSLPIIKALKENENTAIIVSFHSPSGYEHVEIDDDKTLKIYLPLDNYTDQQEMVRILRPDKVVFIKYEFWFNLLRVLTEEDIPYYYTSLHLNASSYLFSQFAEPFLNLIKGAEKIYCHNQHSLAILKEKGFSKLEVFGDSRVQQVMDNTGIDRGEIEWVQKLPVIGLGSLQDEEIDYFCKVVNSNTDKNFLIAAHDIDSGTIAKIKKRLQEDCTLYSNYKAKANRILLVDTIGDLKYLYRNCHAVYVGGGFRKGPHNLLEPIAYGIPTCTGPNIKKFPMAQELIRRGFVVSIPEIEGLELVLNNFLRLDRLRYKQAAWAFLNEQNKELSALINELYR